MLLSENSNTNSSTSSQILKFLISKF